MPYELIPDRLYRMPSHFGPAPGPRQRLGGASFDADPQRPRETTAAVTYLTDAQWLSRHLPPGFSVGSAPEVSVELRMLKDIPWLAGRGYNVAAVLFSAVWDATRTPGRLHSVLWESMADPIITGREELGYPKLFADIPDLELALGDGTVRGQAGWDGFTFLDVRLSELRPVAPGVVRASEQPRFQYKYMPSTGSWGHADACYPVMTPGGQRNRRVEARYIGGGEFAFRPATWEELPTLFHIVNALAELPCRQFVSAEVTIGAGATNLRDQTALRPDPESAER